jgi:D-alanyl-lipoteichoic acid acyltransferase DltB (MBOAT superfamily)
VLFNSIQFLIFFPLVTALYFISPYRYRWLLLLAASCYFYMAFIPVYILILGFTIVVDYFAGIVIENAFGRKRRLFLIFSLLANIGVLFVFKYFNFLNANLKDLADLIHWNYPIHSLSIILPIGLSFHTFQAMSYTIEVYRGRQKAERHFGIYALYVMFYPQLVAGPIERPQNLLHQFREKHDFDYQRVTDGLKLMAWGFFKKIVIADRLAVAVNLVFNEPTKHTGAPLIIATYFFAFQIYCDFSGYSDIAIGAAQVMGFKLMENFKRPYLSASVAEFWTRWHISLSTWFADYIYIPLARSHAKRKLRAPRRLYNPLGYIMTKWGRYSDIYVVFLISGIWHGANWTFIIWGLLHATYLVFSLLTKRNRVKAAQYLRLTQYPTLYKWLKIFVVFHLVAFAWIFFRANTVSDAFYVVRHLVSGLNLQSFIGPEISSKLGMSRTALAITICLILLMEVIHLIQERVRLRPALMTKPVWVRWALYYSVIALILFFGEFGAQQFIYFQF